jgi:hypothetical protein
MSVQKDYTLPTFDSSLTQLYVYGEHSANSTYSARLTGEENRSILYSSFFIDSAHALDIAVLKVTKPSSAIRESSINFSLLNKSIRINYSQTLQIAGYPGIRSNESSFSCAFLPEKYQKALGQDSSYFFIINTPRNNLKGMSGAPIFCITKNGSPDVVGIFVGQNRVNGLGYGLFSYYIRQIILKL